MGRLPIRKRGKMAGKKIDKVIDRLKQKRGTFTMIELVIFVREEIEVSDATIRKGVTAVAVRSGSRKKSVWTIS